MKKKIFFILPPVLLAIVTWIWLFYKDGRWYYYRQEWPFMPLMILHLLFPLFYLVAGVVSLVRLIGKKGGSTVFYLVSSIILTIVCFIGFIAYGIFTSGA